MKKSFNLNFFKLKLSISRLVNNPTHRQDFRMNQFIQQVLLLVGMWLVDCHISWWF